MQQRVLSLSCIGRDVLLSSWLEGDVIVRVYAYRVFETAVGFGVAGQTVDRDRLTETFVQVVPPERIQDGFVSEVQAIDWMRHRANVSLAELVAAFQGQGETVWVGSVEGSDGV